MNKTKNFATYESPVTELLTLELEGAVLADSNASATYEPYTQGNAINF